MLFSDYNSIFYVNLLVFLILDGTIFYYCNRRELWSISIFPDDLPYVHGPWLLKDLKDARFWNWSKKRCWDEPRFCSLVLLYGGVLGLQHLM
jgi:hypothetical protein